jgi:hypothetical protein
MPFDKLRALNLSKGSGLILHFDELSVLSLSKEAALFTPIKKSGFGAVERIKKGGESLPAFEFKIFS